MPPRDAGKLDDVIVPADEALRETFRHVEKFDKLSPALVFSNHNGRLPIVSCDLPGVASKDFYVASYTNLWHFIQGRPKQMQSFYEIILHYMPCKIYLDLDADLALNPDMTPETVETLVKELITELLQLLSELTHNKAHANAPLTILDSSTPIKLSLHVIVDVFLRNNYEVGALVRRLQIRMLRKYETVPGRGDSECDHPFYHWEFHKDVTQPLNPETGKRPMKLVRVALEDFRVCTKRRNFRLYGSSKAVGAYRPLRARGEDSAASLDRDVFMRCLLQRRLPSDRVFAVREYDGTVAANSALPNAFRYDIEGAAAVSANKTSATKRAAPVVAAITDAQLVTHWTEVFPAHAIWKLLGVPEDQASGEWFREFIEIHRPDTWRRHKHFSSVSAMIQSIVQSPPLTLHIGPLESTGTSGGVQQVTLAFDVDIRDFATWRSCCGNKECACETCWPIASFAQRALTAFVEDEYALGKAFTFFSGRKGIHVWVYGAAARELTLPGRDVMIGDFHSVAGAVDLVRPYIQTTLGTEHERTVWAAFIRETMGKHVEFDGLVRTIGRDRAIVRFLWPTLDEAVTKQASHPIKIPFGRHVASGNVCIWLRDATVNPFSAAVQAQNPVDLARAFASEIL